MDELIWPLLYYLFGMGVGAWLACGYGKTYHAATAVHTLAAEAVRPAAPIIDVAVLVIALTRLPKRRLTIRPQDYFELGHVNLNQRDDPLTGTIVYWLTDNRHGQA